MAPASIMETLAGAVQSAVLLDISAQKVAAVLVLAYVVVGRVYRSGRYKKTGEGGMPNAPGAYRAKSKKTGKVVYHGEASNLRKRDKQHRRDKSPHKRGNYYTEFKVADGRSTSNTRRKHEREKIRQHDPKFNKRGGGGGRKAKGGSGRRRKGGRGR